MYLMCAEVDRIEIKILHFCIVLSYGYGFSFDTLVACLNGIKCRLRDLYQETIVVVKTYTPVTVFHFFFYPI
jgi:hypothetical protein